jgi:hypothetical protein
MFPPRAVENLLGDDYDEFKLGMTSGGARKLAAMLVEKANDLDRLGSEGK